MNYMDPNDFEYTDPAWFVIQSALNFASNTKAGTEKHTVSRLIGAPSGYISHDDAGQPQKPLDATRIASFYLTR